MDQHPSDWGAFVHPFRQEFDRLLPQQDPWFILQCAGDAARRYATAVQPIAFRLHEWQEVAQLLGHRPPPDSAGATAGARPLQETFDYLTGLTRTQVRDRLEDDTLTSDEQLARLDVVLDAHLRYTNAGRLTRVDRVLLITSGIRVMLTALHDLGIDGIHVPAPRTQPHPLQDTSLAPEPAPASMREEVAAWRREHPDHGTAGTPDPSSTSGPSGGDVDVEVLVESVATQALASTLAMSVATFAISDQPTPDMPALTSSSTRADLPVAHTLEYVGASMDTMELRSPLRLRDAAREAFDGGAAAAAALYQPLLDALASLRDRPVAAAAAGSAVGMDGSPGADPAGAPGTEHRPAQGSGQPAAAGGAVVNQSAEELLREALRDAPDLLSDVIPAIMDKLAALADSQVDQAQQMRAMAADVADLRRTHTAAGPAGPGWPSRAAARVSGASGGPAAGPGTDVLTEPFVPRQGTGPDGGAHPDASSGSCGEQAETPWQTIRRGFRDLLNTPAPKRADPPRDRSDESDREAAAEHDATPGSGAAEDAAGGDQAVEPKRRTSTLANVVAAVLTLVVVAGLALAVYAQSDTGKHPDLNFVGAYPRDVGSESDSYYQALVAPAATIFQGGWPSDTGALAGFMRRFYLVRGTELVTAVNALYASKSATTIPDAKEKLDDLADGQPAIVTDPSKADAKTKNAATEAVNGEDGGLSYYLSYSWDQLRSQIESYAQRQSVSPEWVAISDAIYRIDRTWLLRDLVTGFGASYRAGQPVPCFDADAGISRDGLSLADWQSAYGLDPDAHTARLHDC